MKPRQPAALRRVRHKRAKLPIWLRQQRTFLDDDDEDELEEVFCAGDDKATNS